MLRITSISRIAGAVFRRASKSLALFFKLEDQEQLLGKADFDFFTSEHAQPARDDELEVMRTGEAIVDKVEKETKSDGS